MGACSVAILWHTKSHSPTSQNGGMGGLREGRGRRAHVLHAVIVWPLITPPREEDGCLYLSEPFPTAKHSSLLAKCSSNMFDRTNLSQSSCAQANIYLLEPLRHSFRCPEIQTSIHSILRVSLLHSFRFFSLFHIGGDFPTMLTRSSHVLPE